MTGFSGLAALVLEIVWRAGNHGLRCVNPGAIRAEIANNMYDTSECQEQHAENPDEADASSKCQCQRMSYTNHHVDLSISAKGLYNHLSGDAALRPRELHTAVPFAKYQADFGRIGHRCA